MGMGDNSHDRNILFTRGKGKSILEQKRQEIDRLGVGSCLGGSVHIKTIAMGNYLSFNLDGQNGWRGFYSYYRRQQGKWSFSISKDIL